MTWTLFFSMLIGMASICRLGYMIGFTKGHAEGFAQAHNDMRAAAEAAKEMNHA